MGLDSVRALQLKHWIERTTNVSLSIAELFDARSLDDLADLIGERVTGAAAADRTAVAVADAGAATGAAAEARAGLVYTASARCSSSTRRRRTRPPTSAWRCG